MKELTNKNAVELVCAERLDEHAVGASFHEKVDFRLMAISGDPQDDSRVAQRSEAQIEVKRCMLEKKTSMYAMCDKGKGIMNCKDIRFETDINNKLY